MSYDFSKVPKEMQDLLCWLTWHRFPQADGKIKKVPDEFTRKDKKITWDNMPYMFMAQAKQKLYSPQSLSDGIGFAFKEQSIFAGIDIDNAILTDGAYNEPVRQKILPILQTARRDGCYIEKSISGTGYHIFGYTHLKPFLLASTDGSGKVNSENVEIHYANSYFTVSANVLQSGWGCLDDSIRVAYQIIKGEPLPETTHENTPTKATNTTTGINIPPAKENAVEHAKTATKDIPAGEFTDADVLALPGLTVASVLDLMSKDTRKNGGEISYAMKVGHPGGYNKSEYDERALGVLTYWLYRYGIDEIVKVFKASALWTDERIKKKSENYVKQATEKAYRNAQKFFPAVNYKRLTAEEKAKLNRWVKRKEREV